MAQIPTYCTQQVLTNDDDDDKVKWSKHYSSDHQILLVGEGDFSFSLSLATSFQSASNIVASSLDSYDDLIKNYKSAKANLKNLGQFRAQLLHGVDATQMKRHTDLQMRKFDMIIYNFPHAGFMGNEDDKKVITKHQNLVYGFFMNASHMLRLDGEVHVTHKTTRPFDLWKIEELADQSGLRLLECVKFKPEDYPGYNNKRGDGHRCDESFPLGKCSTFKFVISLFAKKLTNIVNGNPQQPHIANGSMVMNPAPVRYYFREYFDYAQLTYGQADENLVNVTFDALRIGFERYKDENCGKPLSGYINLLEELQNMCKQRLEFLQKQLSQELVRQHGF